MFEDVSIWPLCVIIGLVWIARSLSIGDFLVSAKVTAIRNLLPVEHPGTAPPGRASRKSRFPNNPDHCEG